MIPRKTVKPDGTGEMGPVDSGVPAIAGPGVAAGATPGSPISMQDLKVNSWSLQPFSAQNDAIANLGEKMAASDMISQALDSTNTPQDVPQGDMWLKRAQDAYHISSSYYDSDIKPKLEDNIRAFNSQHKTNSVYVKSPIGWTSKLYTPMTRTALNKLDAAACVAFFSNQDIVSIEPENPYDPQETLAAQFRKSLLQYRMRKSLNWYKHCLGAFQDSQVQGVVVGHVTWHNETRKSSEIETSQEGLPEVVSKETVLHDKPAIELYSLDNFRIDPSADWIDPVNSSPYVIVIRKTYVGKLKEDIQAGKYLPVSDSLIALALSTDGSIQDTRDNSKSPQSTSQISDFNVVEIQEHIQRYRGEDVIYYTLGTVAKLSEPVPLKKVYWHGLRPYVLGVSHIESHKIFAAGSPEIWSGLQEESNEITNQRLNNVKLTMNKKFIIQSDAQVDLGALLRNQPGSVVFTDDVDKDIKELSTPDVTQSSYLEADRLSQAFNELAGNFNPSAGLVDKQADSSRTNQMLNSNMSVLVEFQLKTFAETYVTPMLSLLDRVEQEYETDRSVLELVGRKAGVLKNIPEATPQPQQPQGAPGTPPTAEPHTLNLIQQIKPMTDEELVKIMQLMKRDLDIRANVGMNATDPMLKLQKLIASLNFIIGALSNPKSAALDIEEIAKEVMALSGYADGLRFLNRQVNPQLAALQQQVVMLTQQLKLRTAEKQAEAQARIALQNVKEKGLNQRKAADIEQDTKKLQAENARTVLDHSRQMEQMNQPKE